MFRNDISFQEAVLGLDEHGLGRHFLGYARRLDVACLVWSSLTKHERRLWKTEDWGTEFVRFKSLASNHTFLQHCLSECIILG
jgi:hypothetical protein